MKITYNGVAEVVYAMGHRYDCEFYPQDPPFVWVVDNVRSTDAGQSCGVQVKTDSNSLSDDERR